MKNENIKDDFGIIGLNLAGAQKILKDQLILNIVWDLKDPNQIVVCEYEPERVNLEVKKGVVVNYSLG